MSGGFVRRSTVDTKVCNVGTARETSNAGAQTKIDGGRGTDPSARAKRIGSTSGVRDVWSEATAQTGCIGSFSVEGFAHRNTYYVRMENLPGGVYEVADLIQ